MNKQESQNQVSIIINGVRYDAVDLPPYVSKCAHCDVAINAFCCAAGERDLCDVFRIGEHRCFKKSDKKLEV